VKFMRQPVEEATVNLTPLIDVVFLLLIFFMVSTTFTKERELVINLPEAVGGEMIDEPLIIEISVDPDGEYAINDKRLINRDPDTLRRAILDASAGNTELPLVITGDKDTPYQAIMTAMDVAGQLGFSHQSLTAKSPQQ